jgi:ABC-type transport system involved in cytochrome c biogenesis permease subunit
MPSIGQLVLLIGTVAALGVGGVLAALRVWKRREELAGPAEVMRWVGVALGAATLVWHCFTRGSWLPLEDNFDTLLWLGLLLAVFAGYMRSSRALGGLDWFVMPVAILLVGAAGLFGSAEPHKYNVASVWHWTHRVTAYGGALAFALAAAAGAMYLLLSWRLRRKKLVPIGGAPGEGFAQFGSLERLERLSYGLVTLGFALLTIGLTTGLFRALAEDRTRLGHAWYVQPKVLLAVGAWLLYALVLHAPINPVFRGRRAAMLSVVGFVLMIGVIVAVQFMPAG